MFSRTLYLLFLICSKVSSILGASRHKFVWSENSLHQLTICTFTTVKAQFAIYLRGTAEQEFDKFTNDVSWIFARLTGVGEERKEMQGKYFESFRERRKIHGFSKGRMAKADQENCKNSDKVMLQRAYIHFLHPSPRTPVVCCFICACFTPL